MMVALSRCVIIILCNQEVHFADRSFTGPGSVRIYGSDRRGVRDVQCRGFRAQACACRKLEQPLVFAVGVGRDQLHAQLGVRGIRDAGIVGRRLPVDDVAATSGAGAAVAHSSRYNSAACEALTP